MADDFSETHDHDLQSGEAERESLPAHVDACSARYVRLRMELRTLARRAKRVELSSYVTACGVVALAAGSDSGNDVIAAVKTILIAVMGG